MLEINGTLIAVIINFLVLAWILEKFLYDPVREMMLERKKGIESKLKEADDKLEKAGQMKVQYEKKLSGSQTEAQSIIKNASATAEKLKADIMASARQDAISVKQQAENEAVEIKKMALKSAKNSLGDLIVGAAGRVVKRNFDLDLQRDIINETMEKVDHINLN